MDTAIDEAAASAPRLHGTRASHSAHRRALPRPVRRVAWALAAVISTGSLAALAREGAFEGWGAAIERMLGTLTGESSTRGAEGALERPAARGVSQAGATETRLAEPTVAGEQRPEDRGPVRDGASGTAQVTAARPQTSATSRLKPIVPRREPAPAVSAEPSAAPQPARTSEELDLIVTARNALATRRHADARATAERHARQFPSGMFGEEREAILALCACRETGASERARSFVERHPDSLFAERIREDCKLVSNLVPGEPPTGTH
jgi:hypothetical protein